MHRGKAKGDTVLHVIIISRPMIEGANEPSLSRKRYNMQRGGLSAYIPTRPSVLGLCRERVEGCACNQATTYPRIRATVPFPYSRKL
jgi:hypothetical protein